MFVLSDELGVFVRGLFIGYDSYEGKNGIGYRLAVSCGGSDTVSVLCSAEIANASFAGFTLGDEIIVGVRVGSSERGAYYRALSIQKVV